MTMRESKRKRLAAKGWKLGGASDFLGLTPEEEAYIELRLKLADGLRKRRKSNGVTQVSLVKSLLALGTSNREIAAIIARR
jgi:hypothetical protein